MQRLFWYHSMIATIEWSMSKVPVINIVVLPASNMRSRAGEPA
jgi:hypothetical protein